MDALEKATSYLNIRPHTEKEVLEYLLRKGYAAEDAKTAVEQLKEYRYIDDLSYSRMYFEYGFERGRGKNRIRTELIKKGVSADLIEEAYNSLEDRPDEYEMAYAIASGVVEQSSKPVSDMTYEERQKLQAKIARRLAGRGFSAGICYSIAKDSVK